MSRRFTAMASATPRSSDSIPGYAAGVSTKTMIGRLNFSARRITRSALRYIFRRRSIIIRFDALRMRYCDMQRNTLPMMFTPTSTPSRTSRSLMRSAGVGWSAAGK